MLASTSPEFVICHCYSNTFCDYRIGELYNLDSKNCIWNEDYKVEPSTSPEYAIAIATFLSKQEWKFRMHISLEKNIYKSISDFSY